MYIDPTVSTPSDASTASEDIDYPPLPLSDEERAEIARIMTNHAQISSNSTSADSSPVSPPSQVRLLMAALVEPSWLRSCHSLLV